MATTPAVTRPGWAWHTRGTWNAREDRVASAVWLGILWVGMIAGFGVDFPRYLHENPPAPGVTHWHAVVFTGWMILLTAQVLLVLKDRVAFHRKLGWLLVGWAGLMAVLGPWAALSSLAVNLHLPAGDTPFFSVNLVDIGAFLVLLAWGLASRRNPAAHKRLMILATVSLADPGFSRFSGWIWATGPSSMLVWFFWVFYGNVLLVVLMLGWDWWRGRMMKQAVIGGVALLGAEYAATLLYFWGPWRAATERWVEAWARVIG
ncbi:MAG: hypothetical protein KGN79_01745 [Acidobacteriota bacterium]|nr:hypothetical protein [Acidobacteriota bacterium]